MTARWLFRVALLISLAAAAANADGPPIRIFHIGIVSGSPRSHPANVAFEDRLRELGYVEGRNLAIDYVHYDDLDRLAAAVGEMVYQGRKTGIVTRVQIPVQSNRFARRFLMLSAI